MGTDYGELNLWRNKYGSQCSGIHLMGKGEHMHSMSETEKMHCI